MGGGGGHKLHLSATLVLDVVPEETGRRESRSPEQGDRSGPSGRLILQAKQELQTGATLDQIVAHLVDTRLREMLMQLVTLARSADVKLTHIVACPAGGDRVSPS